VIFLFMHGGPSQVDTFDYKPLLAARPRQAAAVRQAARPVRADRQPAEVAVEVRAARPERRVGERAVPDVARTSTDLCFVKSPARHERRARRRPARAAHRQRHVRAAVAWAAWVLYGLGSENQNLPGFVTICPTLGHGGVNNWSSAFLPGVYQGTPIGNASVPSEGGGSATCAATRAAQQRASSTCCTSSTPRTPGARADDPCSRRASQSFELAFRMQTEAPEVLDLAARATTTPSCLRHRRPKTENFGRQCLMARRCRSRRALRAVHAQLQVGPARATSKPTTRRTRARSTCRSPACCRPAGSAGLLDDTLVWWGGEFGRTPTAQGGNGRDHNPHAFTMWPAAA
jgi:hypothetical protein